MWSVLSRYVGRCPSNPSQCYWTLVRNKMQTWIRRFLGRIKRLEAKSISLFGRQWFCRKIENYCQRGLLNQLNAALHKEFHIWLCTIMLLYMYVHGYFLTIITCKQIFKNKYDILFYFFSKVMYIICISVWGHLSFWNITIVY